MKFKKGQSGNPGGRPRGSRNLSTVFAPKRKGDLTTLVDNLWVMALNNNMDAIRLLVSRLYPQAKATAPPVELPNFSGGPSERAEAIITAVAAGEVPVDVGGVLLDMLAMQCKISEHQELREQIERMRAELDELKRGAIPGQTG